MSTKRKRDSEEDTLSTPPSKLSRPDDVTRSGRVRKKPAKFVDEDGEEVEVRVPVEPLKAVPVSPILLKTVAPPPAPRPPTIVTIEAPVSEGELLRPSLSSDEGEKSAVGRAGRARKKSAKVLEMEEFEEAEKKEVVKKSTTKKMKAPTSPIYLNTKGAAKPGMVLGSPLGGAGVHISPTTSLKIKDIHTSPKIEPGSSAIALQLASQHGKVPVLMGPKSPGAPVVSPPREDKGSVIKLLLSSPSQTSGAALSPSKAQLSPPAPAKLTSKKKPKVKEKLSTDTKTKQALNMVQPTQVSPVEITLSSSDHPLLIDTGKGDAKSKDIKVKKSKKSAMKDEPHFSAAILPSPNVIHVGAMNVEGDGKGEGVTKKKKIKDVKPKMQAPIGMDEPMMNEEFGLDMPEITLGDTNDDSFMDIDDDDLVIPDDEDDDDDDEEEDMEAVQPKFIAKKKKVKTVGKHPHISLGDADGELVMDFARMKPEKGDEKKKKKLSKDAAKELELANKKKRAPTAYMMWCNANRPKVVADNPGIDFSSISKTLGEMWSTLSEKDKMLWKRKAKKASGKGSTLITTGKAAVPKIIPQQPTVVPRQPLVLPQKVNPALTTALLAPKQTKPVVEDVPIPVKGFGIDPVDVAAHLKIVGESLSIIGMRLQEHRGLIAVQGSLSVLLDSMLCALGPLLCLTSILPQTDGLPHQTHMNTLDNIAYIMPGL